MIPYYEEPGIQIFHGDCREILPQLSRVDVVIADPPYGVTSLDWDSAVDGWAYLVDHRLVMADHINRPLYEWEIVHHLNGVKADNRIDNLMIVTKKTHNGKVICPHCHKQFAIR